MEALGRAVMKKYLIPLIFLSVLAASLTANVYLSRELLNQKTSTGNAKQTAEGKVGQHLDLLHVRDVDGTPSLLSLSRDRPTVVYVFSPKCHWCKLNLRNIQTLYATSMPDYDFVGIAADSNGLADYLAQHPYKFPVYKEPAEVDLRAIGFTGTPQTLLIDRSGNVQHNWIGAYAGKVGDSIQRTFSVSLPGLDTKEIANAVSTPVPTQTYSRAAQSRRE